MGQVVVGMDPHKRPATIEVIDAHERVLAVGRFGTGKAGYAEMLAVGREYPDRVWAVEGCNGAGRHLAHRLVHDGETVVDVPAKLSAQVRVFATGNGRKSDPVDAHSVAMAALRAPNLLRVEVDTGAFGEADVASLPVMTKTDLMDNFDDIVTDRRLTRELCERHLGELAGDAYLLWKYHVVASGGSSDQRGVFVYGWDAWAICWASMVRFPQRDWAADPALAGVRRVAAVVAASRATHISAAFRHTFATPQIPEHLIPATWPLGQIVASLNRLQPTELIGYSSVLPRLASEARAGRLRIWPRR